MKKPEVTSKRVAKIAAKVLRNLSDAAPRSMVMYKSDKYDDCWSLCTVGELKALAASALTQTEDKTR